MTFLGIYINNQHKKKKDSLNQRAFTLVLKYRGILNSLRVGSFQQLQGIVGSSCEQEGIVMSNWEAVELAFVKYCEQLRAAGSSWV